MTEAADEFIGRTQRQSARYALVYRSVNHKSLQSLCEDIKKSKLPAKYSSYEPKGGFGPNLIALATAVVDLQEKRHLADYDPLFRVRMSDALLAVATSRDALTRFRKVNRTRRKNFLFIAYLPAALNPKSDADGSIGRLPPDMVWGARPGIARRARTAARCAAPRPPIPSDRSHSLGGRNCLA
jgi:hypothetical protein